MSTLISQIPSTTIISTPSPPISTTTKLSPTFLPLHSSNLTPSPIRFTTNNTKSNKPLTLTSATATTTGDLDSTTQPPSLKSRLRNGETLYGMFLCSSSATLAEIAGHAGYDFVVVDMEHGYGGISEALNCLRALAATNTAAILRLPESTAVWAKKALDLGPQGIMFPMIESSKDAKKAVSYCRYPPNGVRGAAHPIVRASGYGVDAGGYLSSYEEEVLVMCQVESEDAVEKVEDIADVDGVDCIQMGPLDLSASLGYLWDPGNKRVMQTLHKVEKAVLKSREVVVVKEGKDGKSKKSGGAYLCGFAMPHDGPEELKSRGYHMISGAVDIALFRSAAVEDVKRFKEMGDGDVDDDDGDDDRTADGKDGDEKYWSE